MAVIKIREVLKHKGSAIEAVQASDTLADAIARFGKSKVRALVVLDGDEMVGILAIRDVLARIDEAGPVAIEESVRDAMTSEVVSLAPEDSVDVAHELVLTNGIHHLPVLEGGQLVGLVTPVDFLGRYVTDLDRQRSMLEAYITNTVL